MRILVTGGSGFVGGHLLAHLEAQQHVAFWTYSTSTGRPRSSRAFELRLPSEERSFSVLESVRPDAVIHLAAVAFVKDAEADPVGALAVNVDGTADLLKALKRHDPESRVRFIYVSTAQVYDARGGASQREVFLTEESPLWPQNLYAQTKLGAELAADVHLNAQKRHGVIFRPFNHAGPGQRPVLVLANFARQVAAIEAGRAPPVLETGNLDVSRDFSSVHDIVAAYRLAAEGQVPPGTYNLASGVATSLREIVEILRSLSRAPFEVAVRSEKLRPGEPGTVRGSFTKIQSACGWSPTTPLVETIRDILGFWREEEKKSHV